LLNPRKGKALKPEEIKRTILPCARELSLSRKEMASVLNETVKETRCVGRLWGNPNDIKDRRSRLIKLGLALIAFPDPTISDVIGAMLVAAGLVQEKIKQSPLKAVDVYNTFQDVTKEIQKIRQGII
jgi:hypothetical protein